LHCIIAFLLFSIKPLGKIYLPIVVVLSFFWIIINENKNNEVLYACAYIVGAEVLHRMTSNDFLFEIAKYSVAGFSVLGFFFSGISRRASIFYLFLLLLLPGILIGAYTLNLEAEVRKNIIFNVIGPVTLAICSIYTYGKKMTLSQINNLLLVLSLPIISTAVYLFFYTPNIKELITGTGSNFETSGGFGPNQVSTILGFGCFVFFTRLLLESKKPLLFIVNMVIFFYITYRGFITFSRGGMITAFVMIVVFLFIVFRSISSKAKDTLFLFVVISSFVFAGIWTYSNSQTSGLIENRYSNKDALGRKKESQLTGREDIMASEIEMFKNNIIFGVGAGKGREIRQEMGFGSGVNSHDELTRMLGEHGLFGLIGLIILFLVPIVYNLRKSELNYNLYAIPFLFFWLLTLNHAAMRIAAPAFIYALSLLNVYAIEDEKPVVHRE